MTFQANLDRLGKFFSELCSIASPSLHEREVGEYIKDYLKSIDLEVEEDNAAEELGGYMNNLRTQIAGRESSPVFIVSHMDTVQQPDQEAPKVIYKDGIFRSDGTTILGGDCKCGIAVLLELLTLLRERGTPQRGLVAAFTVAEEIGLLGQSVMPASWYENCAYGVALDESYPYQFVKGAPTRVQFSITVKGIEGHAAHPDHAINAAHALCVAMGRLPVGHIDSYTTANLGILKAGIAVNIIPGSAHAEYEIRSHHPERLRFHVHRTLGIIEGAIREIREFNPELDLISKIDKDNNDTDKVKKATVDVVLEKNYDSFLLADDALPIIELAAAIRACDADPVGIIGAGGSDANILNANKLPTVILGCGMHNVHTKEEYASLEEMAQTVDVVLELLGSRPPSASRVTTGEVEIAPPAPPPQKSSTSGRRSRRIIRE